MNAQATSFDPLSVSADSSACLIESVLSSLDCSADSANSSGFFDAASSISSLEDLAAKDAPFDASAIVPALPGLPTAADHRDTAGQRQVRVETTVSRSSHTLLHHSQQQQQQQQLQATADWTVLGPRPYARTQIPMRGLTVPQDAPIRRYSGNHDDDEAGDRGGSRPATPDPAPRSILSASNRSVSVAGGQTKTSKTVTFDSVEVVKRTDELQVHPSNDEALQDAVNSDSPAASSPSESTDDSSSTAGAGSGADGSVLSDQLIRACNTFAAWHEDSTTISANDLNEALGTVKAEWFKVCCNQSVEDVTAFMSRVGARSTHLLEKMVNFSDDNGNSSLHYAVSQSNWRLVRALLASGLVTAADRANRSGYSAPMLVGLCRLPPLSAPSDSSDTTSSAEAEEARKAASDLLASAGDINAKAVPSGRTALMLAADHGRLEALRLLLQLGADPNLQDDEGLTALMLAADQGHLDCVRALLAHPGLDLELRDNDGATALSVAMDSGHRDAALLIYARAKLGGRTPAGASGSADTFAEFEAELSSSFADHQAADELSSLLLMQESDTEEQQPQQQQLQFAAETSTSTAASTEALVQTDQQGSGGSSGGDSNGLCSLVQLLMLITCIVLTVLFSIDVTPACENLAILSSGFL